MHCNLESSLGDASFRILCVDENPEVRRTLKLGFESCGFTVVTASPGIDAFMQFHGRRGNFAAILTDHDAPIMNGMVLIKWVRASDFKGRILVMSGSLSVEDFQAYRDCEVSGFLSKPFQINVAAAMLFQAINGDGILPPALPPMKQVALRGASSE